MDLNPFFYNKFEIFIKKIFSNDFDDDKDVIIIFNIDNDNSAQVLSHDNLKFHQNIFLVIFCRQTDRLIMIVLMMKMKIRVFFLDKFEILLKYIFMIVIVIIIVG